MVYRITFSFTLDLGSGRLCPNCTRRCASIPALIKTKSRSRSNGPQIDFSDGVPHNLFTYGLIASKFHQMCTDTSLAKHKLNSRFRSNAKVKRAKTRFFRRRTAQHFHIPTDCAQIPPERVNRHQFSSRHRKL